MPPTPPLPSSQRLGPGTAGRSCKMVEPSGRSATQITRSKPSVAVLVRRPSLGSEVGSLTLASWFRVWPFLGTGFATPSPWDLCRAHARARRSRDSLTTLGLALQVMTEQVFHGTGRFGFPASTIFPQAEGQQFAFLTYILINVLIK